MSLQTAPSPAPARPLIDIRRLMYAPFAVFIVHTVEEMPGFAAWVTAHFGHMTTEKFAFTHIPLILLVLLCSARASGQNPAAGWVLMAAAFQWQFAVNALFHLSTAVYFGDYSPGMVTAATVALPTTAYVLSRIRRERLLTGGQLGGAIAVGTAIAAIAIGVLFIG